MGTLSWRCRQAEEGRTLCVQRQDLGFSLASEAKPPPSWRRTRNPGPARPRGRQGPGSRGTLPPRKARRPGPVPRMRKWCSLGSFQMEGTSWASQKSPGE